MNANRGERRVRASYALAWVALAALIVVAVVTVSMLNGTPILGSFTN